MKTLTFAAALMLGTAAFAQSTTAPMSTPPADTMTTPKPADPMSTPPADAMSAPANDPMSQQKPADPMSTTRPSATPMAGEPMTNAAPPAGNAPMMAAPMAAEAPAAQASYPRCSASVTDQCRQGSARESDRKGGPRKRRG